MWCLLDTIMKIVNSPTFTILNILLANWNAVFQDYFFSLPLRFTHQFHTSLRICLHPGCLPWNSTKPSRKLAAHRSTRRAWHQYLVPNCHTGAASQPLQMYTDRSHILLHCTPCLMYQTAGSPHVLPDIPDFIHLLPDIFNHCSPHILHLTYWNVVLHTPSTLPGILNCCALPTLPDVSVLHTPCLTYRAVVLHTLPDKWHTGLLFFKHLAWDTGLLFSTHLAWHTGLLSSTNLAWHISSPHKYRTDISAWHQFSTHLAWHWTVVLQTPCLTYQFSTQVSDGHISLTYQFSTQVLDQHISLTYQFSTQISDWHISSPHTLPDILDCCSPNTLPNISFLHICIGLMYQFSTHLAWHIGLLFSTCLEYQTSPHIFCLMYWTVGFHLSISIWPIMWQPVHSRQTGSTTMCFKQSSSYQRL